jgi:hypothetical protein
MRDADTGFQAGVLPPQQRGTTVREAALLVDQDMRAVGHVENRFDIASASGREIGQILA